MPLQNRVDPWGRLHSVEARGAWMGNRGILHDPSKTIVRPWRSKAWILCKLEFKGRRRKLFSPGRYSELFFLDEATAFAAGHRPCAECNRARFNELRQAWAPRMRTGARAGDIDRVLHEERIARHHAAALRDLPEGVIVDYEGGALLLLGDALLPWSFTGYGAPLPRPSAETRASVLTPRSMVRAIAHGFKPQIHPSAYR